MGQTEVKFEQGEALDGTGLPVLISSTLDGFTSEQWWDMFESSWRTRKPDASRFETECTVTDLGDGSFVCATFVSVNGGLSELASGRIAAAHFFVKLHINREEDMCVTHTYVNDETLSDENCSEVSYLKVHHDPFRFEFYQEEKPLRVAGPWIKTVLEDSLKKASINVETYDNQPSPTDATKRSVLTGSLDGLDLTIEKLFELQKKQAVEQEYATEIPGGVLIEKELFVTTIYTTISMADEHIYIKVFGNDETLQDLRVVFACRMVADPPRVELWGEHQPRREAAEKARAIIEPMVNHAIKLAKGEAAA